MFLAICTTQVKKESKKDILKRKNNKLRKNFLQGDSNPDPQNQLQLNVNPSIHWTSSVNTDKEDVQYQVAPGLPNY